MNLKILAKSVLLSLLLTSCPGMDFGLNGGLDGRLDGEHRADLIRRLAEAQAEVNAKTASPEAQAASPFNSLMQSNGVFRAMELGREEVVSDFFSDPNRGFGFQCSEDDDVEKYEMALRDFNYNANLVGMLLNADAFKEIRSHEDGLKRIPVAVARNAFLGVYGSTTGDAAKTLVLPPGSKASLNVVKSKYNKLQELKAAMVEITAGRSNAIRSRWERAERLLNEYEAINVTGSLNQLVDEAKLATSFKESPIKNDLASVRAFLENGARVSDGAGGIAEVESRNQEAAEKIRYLEETVHNQYEDLIQTVYAGSGNFANGSTDQYVAEFFSQSNAQLTNKAIEVTGWNFSMDMKFDLMENVLEAQPSVNPQLVYQHMQAQLANSNSNAANAVKFFKNYEKLEYFKGNSFFNDVFGSNINTLEDHFDLSEDAIGEVSSFRHFVKLMCSGKGRGCDVADIFGDTYRDPQSFQTLMGSLGRLASISPLTRENLVKRLNAIDSAKRKMQETFAACHTKVSDATLKTAIKVKQEDYIQCHLLEGVISTDGLGSICGENSASYLRQRRVDGAGSGRGTATVIETGVDSIDAE